MLSDILFLVVLPVAVIAAPIAWFFIEWNQVEDDDLTPREPDAFR